MTNHILSLLIFIFGFFYQNNNGLLHLEVIRFLIGQLILTTNTLSNIK
ncbi:hypothetical protein CHCC20375_3024 [Bacillus licheniformis]|nr:hypothetical protein CHCC20375_3024 [Bacillus licheniformis]